MIFLIAFVIVFVVYFIAAFEFQNIALEKGYGGSKYFWYCFLLGIAGWLMVAALPDRKEGYGRITGVDMPAAPKKENQEYLSDELPDL